MAAGLTKEQLKNELISHGVQPPVQSARKEEFVKLYEQHVAPIVAQKGDFSSDEETEVAREPTPTNNSLVCNGVDVASLSDEELYAQLQSFGIPVGPIVDTTRSVYQRKLAALLQNGVPSEIEQTNGNGNENSNGNIPEEKYSDSEEELEKDIEVPYESAREAEPELFVTHAAPRAEPIIIATPEPLTSIRKRVMERPSSSLSALPLVDRQGTPTPRPSIRTVTGSSQYGYEPRTLRDTTDSGVQQLPSKQSASPVGNILRLIFILIVVGAAAYIAYSFGHMDCVKQWFANVRSRVFQYVEKVESVAEKIDHAKPNPMPDV